MMIEIKPPTGPWTGASIAAHLGVKPDAVALVGDHLEIDTDLSGDEVRAKLKTYPGPPPPPPDPLAGVHDKVGKVQAGPIRDALTALVDALGQRR